MHLIRGRYNREGDEAAVEFGGGRLQGFVHCRADLSIPRIENAIDLEAPDKRPHDICLYSDLPLTGQRCRHSA